MGLVKILRKQSLGEKKGAIWSIEDDVEGAINAIGRGHVV